MKIEKVAGIPEKSRNLIYKEMYDAALALNEGECISISENKAEVLKASLNSFLIRKGLIGQFTLSTRRGTLYVYRKVNADA